jgi:hypothetical protein
VTTSRSVRVYRGLLRVYPRAFRDEYGTDMALLFADQLRDEAAPRVWARGVVDLAITIPARHLEAHMTRPPNPIVPIVYAAISLTGLLFGVVVGSEPGTAVFGLVVAVAAGVLAFASWRRTRPVTAPGSATERWWQVVLAGGGLLGATIAVLTVVGEVSEGWWAPTMLVLLAGILTTATGVILGIAHVTVDRPRRSLG